jgi:hypothetical protein
LPSRKTGLMKKRLNNRERPKAENLNRHACLEQD